MIELFGIILSVSIFVISVYVIFLLIRKFPTISMIITSISIPIWLASVPEFGWLMSGILNTDYKTAGINGGLIIMIIMLLLIVANKALDYNKAH